jgi:hypothetical protein
MTGPFEALGLTASQELSDDEVRAAWRRVAAATHPDRPDGGDLAAFAAAAAAYTTLRTQAGRDDALAGAEPERRVGPAGMTARVRAGRPRILVIRLLTVTAVSALALTAVGWQPAALGVMTGALTWLAASTTSDLAPSAGRRPDRRRCALVASGRAAMAARSAAEAVVLSSRRRAAVYRSDDDRREDHGEDETSQQRVPIVQPDGITGDEPAQERSG